MKLFYRVLLQKIRPCITCQAWPLALCERGLASRRAQCTKTPKHKECIMSRWIKLIVAAAVAAATLSACVVVPVGPPQPHYYRPYYGPGYYYGR